jgi:hypothetical protein
LSFDSVSFFKAAAEEVAFARFGIGCLPRIPISTHRTGNPLTIQSYLGAHGFPDKAPGFEHFARRHLANSHLRALVVGNQPGRIVTVLRGYLPADSSHFSNGGMIFHAACCGAFSRMNDQETRARACEA